MLVSTLAGDAVSVQEVFLAGCGRYGPQTAPVNSGVTRRGGGDEVARVPITEVGDVELKPAVLRDFVVSNVDALVAEAATLA